MSCDYGLLGELLKNARDTANMKQSEVADLIGCTAANISSWERAKSKIDIESLASICNIYKIDFSTLISQVTNSKRSKGLSTKEKEHIKKYRTLDEYGKEAVDSILDIEHKRCTYIPTLSIARSTNKDDKLQIRNVPDLSQFPEDDSDL